MSVHSVEGYEIDVEDSETAEKDYDRYIDEGDYIDPIYYEEVNID